MPRAKPPIFRPTEVTLWPRQPGAVPQTWKSAGALTLVGGTICAAPLDQQPDDFGELVDIPVDFALREVRDLDLGDDEAVVAFVETWGGSTAWAEHPEGWGHSIADERQVLQWSQRMIEHWLLAEAGESVLPLWSGAVDGGPTDERDCWDAWVRMVNHGLRAWSMHLALRYPDAEEVTRGDDLDMSLQLTTPAQAVAWQLAAMAGGGAVIRYCLNENCGRPFTRQRGRAEYSARERGVMYCSHQCAKAKSERERRARRKAEQT